MPQHDPAELLARKDWRSLFTLARETQEVPVILALTRHARPEVRVFALKELCPCRVKADVPEFWERVLEMAADEDRGVRWQVLHTLCDGAPGHLELRIADALERFQRDADAEIKRRAHKVLANYARTGKWNIL